MAWRASSISTFTPTDMFALRKIGVLGAGGLQRGLILPGQAGGADDAGQAVRGTVLRGGHRPGG